MLMVPVSPSQRDMMASNRLGFGSMMSAGTMRTGGSVYHDAYTGLEELEE